MYLGLSSGGVISGVQPPPFPAEPEPWVRPADWLPLPTISPGDQIFAGLFAIFDGNPNYVALVAEGDYTVDWGDGVVENVASGVTAEHAYDYSTYDVAEATLCSRGYKQAVIQVTPQAGSDLTHFGWKLHSAGGTIEYAWLDAAINSTALVAGYNNDYMFQPGGSTYSNSLERIYLGENAIAVPSEFIFAYNRGLQSVEVANFDAATDCSFLFYQNYSLRSAILPDLPLCTTLNQAFYGCTALEKIVIGDCPLLEDGSYMAEDCSALKVFQIGQAGLIGQSSNVDLNSMFTSCYALTHITFGDVSLPDALAYSSYLFENAATPLYLSFGNVIGDGTLDFNSFDIANPYLIQYIKIGNLPDVTSLASMCYDLEGLRIFEMGDAPNCASFSAFLNTYGKLESITLGDMSAATDMAEAFASAYGAKRIVCGDLPLVAYFGLMCHQCRGLEELTLGDIDGSADFANTLTACYNLRKLTVGNILGTTFPTALFASAPALQEIVVGDCPDVENLGGGGDLEIATAAKIHVGNMPSVYSLYYFIGTYNGSAVQVKDVVFGATPVCSDFSGLFAHNTRIVNAPLFDTSSASGNAFDSFANGASALQTLPAYDLSAVISLPDFVSGCTALQRSQVFGARVSHSYANCNLQVPALVEIFENLGTAYDKVDDASLASRTIGDNYAVGDTGHVVGGNNDATYEVTSIDGGGGTGPMGTVTLVAPGSGYLPGETYALAASGSQPGIGDGATFTLVAVELTITGNPGVPYLTAAQIAIAEAKGWTVVTA